MPDDLSELFPELAAAFGNDAPTTPTSVPGDSNERAAEYVRQRLGGRAPMGVGGSTDLPAGGVEGGEPGNPPQTQAQSAPSQDESEGDGSESEGDEGEEQEGTEGQPANQPAEGDTEGGDGDDDTNDIDDSSTSLPDFVTLNGRRLPRSQIEAYAQFDDFLARNPQVARQIAAAINGQSQGQPNNAAAQGGVGVQGGPPAPGAPGMAPNNVPGAPQLPDNLDLDDPTTRFLWDTIQRQNAQLQSLAAGVNQTAALYQQQTQVQQQAIVDRAQRAFQQAHGLSDEDVDRISKVAANLNVLPNLLAPVDPVTGAPRQVDVLQAVEKALETALYIIPEYRDREYARQRQQHIQQTKKKQRAGALAGSSGSVPRQTAPVIRTDAERRAAMVAEVAAMQSGNWNEGE